MNTHVNALIDQMKSEVGMIETERQSELSDVSALIASMLKDNQNVNIIVVCTHNSRRSQLGEAWINILSNYFGLSSIKAFSGGMETTAFNERMVSAMKSLNIPVKLVEDGQNPRYIIEDIGKDGHLMFSKVYDDELNPQSGYIALMVCDHADENCPVVIGMKHRIPLRYKDPKAFDGTELEEKAYKDKVKEVGREMVFLFQEIMSNL
ncbi:MAG: hypothetical protein P1U56_18650 [Saprospiraceae bacterium]|nr:hypothetical protein [Saprospiraceae bacterium]